MKSLGGATLLFLCGFLLALPGGTAEPAHAADDAVENPSEDIEPPAQIAPDDAEEPSEAEPGTPKTLDRSFMRPDLKQGGEGAPPPRSADESKRDKLQPKADDLPLPSPVDKPKLLAHLYQELSEARDAQAAAPIMEAIEHLWRLSGSDTVDLLLSRVEHFAKAADLDLALKIGDAAVDMAPDGVTHVEHEPSLALRDEPVLPLLQPRLWNHELEA